jgi:hypothetical protein
MIDFGYYIYKDEPYFDRVQILDKMLENKDYGSSFHFHFHDEYFASLNWSIEPEFDIGTLYKLRAQQLRDKYKYLVVQFSGGSDSTQILRTFLDNGIFIDEIQCFHFETLVSKVSEQELLSGDDSSILLEYKYAAKPFLEKFKEKSPNTKISSIDLSKRFTEDLVNGEYAYLGVNKNQTIMASTVYNTTPKAYNYYSLKYIEEQYKQRDGIAIVRGFDKPKLYIDKEGDMYFYFNDMIINGNRNMIMGDLPNIGVIENFYWSKDAPLIPIKQSHMVLNQFKRAARLKKVFKLYKGIARDHEKETLAFSFTRESFLLERLLSFIIYPNWSMDTYTGTKEEKMASDFAILEKTGIKHHGQQVMEERRNFMLNKYRKIENKSLLYTKINTKPYYIGKVE